MKFKQFWAHFKDSPLKGRNAILRGICPQVFGLFTVKLAVALTLIGGVQMSMLLELGYEGSPTYSWLVIRHRKISVSEICCKIE
ncbi:probable DNA helicase MCM9 [Vigna umbellata]|uniref:probable DNA helicase MCM9 n=1 Tax=Vigna umbellata TaxID=87088 RepID=UPI001F5F5DFE|nr:probable DNA helicase MCM9 [Vigna umbellata]